MASEVALSAAAFEAPPVIVTGSGASQAVGEHAARLGASRALIVTDPFMVHNGTAEVVQSRLTEAGVPSTVFDRVTPDPTDTVVADGLQVLAADDADLVIGLGGGSPLDAAKMIAIGANNPSPLREFMGYHRIPAAGLPLIAIPTTAGTGSEATRVTVITETATHTKMMILDGKLLPSVALVDFELTMTMPAALTCHVGVDTLTHGIEAYVSERASRMTDPYALSCISLVGRFLERAWRDGEDREAREAMSIAACHGGLAFSNSSVCLVHGMSRPLGAVFGVAHGLSNAVLLPTVVRYSVSGALPRYATVARTLGLAAPDDSDEVAGDRLVEGIEVLNATLGVPRLRELPGVDRDALEAAVEKMADDALASGSPARNPIVPTAQDVQELYRSAW